jgi:hypothetical protein
LDALHAPIVRLPRRHARRPIGDHAHLGNSLSLKLADHGAPLVPGETQQWRKRSDRERII